MSIFRKCAALAAAALLALPSVSLLSAGAVGVQDDGSLSDGTFTYELNNGSYTIVSCTDTAILTEVPELVNGYAVTAIGDQAFIGCNYISELKIPESVKSIGASAFAGCTSLKKITLPKKLTTISDSAFFGCTALEDIEIPEGVTYIGTYAFYNCNSLTDITLPSTVDTIKEMAFAECEKIDTFDASECKAFTFSNGILYTTGKTEIVRASTKLEGDVRIEDTVKTIQPGAFSLCYNIEHLFCGEMLSNIGEDAFGYCKNLKSVNFTNALVEIAPIAFKYCVSLESVDLPVNLNTIGDGAFYNCQKLNRLIIPESVKEIGTGAFLSCPELKQIIVPKSVSSIGDSAFGFKENSSTGAYEPVEGFSMSVFKDSAALKYAKSSKISYVVEDKSLKQTAFIIVAVGAILAAIVFAGVLMARGRKSASAEVKKSDKLAKEQAEDESYTKIVDDDSPENK